MVNIQGRKIAPDIEGIIQLLNSNPDWGRTRLSEELCRAWNWRTVNGRLKDMACRTMLLKLERAGHICLPPRKHRSTNAFRNRTLTDYPHDTETVCCSLQELQPIEVTPLSQQSAELSLFKCLLARYHYLGFITNNTRFLILPWVQVPHLASHILAQIAKRLNSDWLHKYGHPVYLLETSFEKVSCHWASS